MYVKCQNQHVENGRMDFLVRQPYHNIIKEIGLIKKSLSHFREIFCFCMSYVNENVFTNTIFSLCTLIPFPDNN